jgi:TP901 family phage tail tape measure protein
VNYKFSIQVEGRLSAASIQQIKAQIQQIGKDAGVKIDSSSIKQTSSALKDATKQSASFAQSIGDSIKKMALWSVAGTALFGTLRLIKDGVTAVKNLDSALVELRKVTDLTASGLQNVVEQASAIGDTVARTTTDIVRATSDFAKMGYSVKESLNLAKQAEIMVNVADGIDDVSVATDTLVASIKGFALESDSAASIVDKLNEVSNKYAVDVDDLATGITKVSASLAAAGNNLDQSIAMITAGTEVLQDSSRVSIGLRTISMRLRGVSEEGEDLADLVPKLEDEFNSIGIALLDENRNFRSTYDVLVDLSKVWDGLTDIQRANLTYLIAGTRQSDVLNGVLVNRKTLTDSLITSIESEGSAMRENAQYMDSITAKTELFSKAMQDMWTNAVNSSSIKGIVDFGTSIIKMADSLDLVNVGLSVLFAWLVRIAAVKIISWVTTLSGALSGMFSSMGDFKAGMSLLFGGLKSFGITAGIAAVIYGVTKTIEKLKELENTYQDLKKESDDYVKTFVNNKDSILQMVDSLSDIKQGSEEYYEVSNKLADLLPQIVDYVDEEGNAHLKTSEYIDQHIASLEGLSSAYRESIAVDFKEEIALLEGLSEKYEALNKKINSYQATFGNTPVIFGKAIDGGNIELTPEMTFNQAYLDFQSEIVYQQIRDSLVDQVVSGTNTDKQFADALGDYISRSIAGADVSTPENIAAVGGKALEIAQAFNDALSGIDSEEMSTGIEDILAQFADKDFAASPSYITSFQDAVRDLGTELGLTGQPLSTFIEYVTSLKTASQSASDAVEDLFDPETFQKNIALFNSAMDASNEALASQAENGYVTADAYQKLIALSPDYAQALMYENGQMKLNTDVLNEHNDILRDTTLLEIENQRALDQEKYSQNAETIDKLRGMYSYLTEAQRAELAQLEAENAALGATIGGYDVLAGEIRDASSAFNEFETALQSTDTGANYMTLQKAIETINEGLKSGKTNTDQFKAAVDLLYGSNVPDNLKSATKELGTFISDEGNSFNNIIDKFKELDDSVVSVKKNAEGQISLDIPNLDDLATALGTSRETVDALLGELEEYGDISFTDTKQGIDDIAGSNETAADKAQTLYDKLNNVNNTTVKDLGFTNLASKIQTAITKVNILIGRIRAIPRVPSGFASGTQSAPSGKALVGEEGRELRISNGKVSLVGVGGAEIVNLKSGDTIIPNEETEDILSGRIPALATGASGTFTPPPKSKGGGSSGGSKSKGSSSSSSSDDEPTYINDLKNYFDIQTDILDSQIDKREENIKLVDDQIDKEQEFLNAMRKQNEEADRQRELQEAIAKLNNIRNEKNVRMLNAATGKFEWVADPRALRDQEEVVANLQRENDRYMAEQAIQSRITALEKQKSSEEDIIDQLKEQQSLMSEFSSDIGLLDDEVQKNIGSWEQLIAAMQQAGLAFTDISSLWGGSGAQPSPSTGSGDSKVSAVGGTLKKGSRGEDVKKLQRALNALGYNAGSVDGVFGSNTYNAVKAFQKAMGISADGIVGKNTKAKFKTKGYKDGGIMDSTGLFMGHGTRLEPEYVYSAKDVKSIMGSIPQILANIANGGGLTIENMTVVTPNANNFMQQMKNQMALGSRVPKRG